MGTRHVISLACLVALAACSPGRIGADGETGDGSGSTSESEDGPIVETGSDDQTDEGDGDGDGDPWGGGCSREGSLKWLDICERPEPCASTICENGEECLGGLCVAPKPMQACEGIELVLHDVVELIAEDNAPFQFADVDGLAGDELITADDGVLQVVRAGELLDAANRPSLHLSAIHPLQLGGDDHVDLLAYSGHYEQGYTIVLSGDGTGHFAPAQTQLPSGIASPFPIDFDNDGDHDVLARSTFEPIIQLYRNDAGTLAWLTSFDIDGALGVAVDLDLDGFVDDALFGSYPSPTVLLGEGGQLVEAGSLPEPMRGPELQYGVGAPLVADLDGDGWNDVVTVLDDGSRAGARIWWGLPGNTFADPIDQLLLDERDFWDADLDLIGVVDLDGAPPLELVVSGQLWVGYVRPAPVEQLPFGCFAPIFEAQSNIYWEPTLGDLEADGEVELAIRDYLDAEVYTVVAVP